METWVKIVVYVPVTHAEKIRTTLAASGCGRLGAYDFCSFSVRGIGRFRPGREAHPFLGTKGKVKKVLEERIETICSAREVKKVLRAIKKAHPYEEPAIDVYQLLK